jgi:bifunctional NMN adenylyltransferase/nudix hydrolase
MNKKPYDIIVYIGRFQPFHNAHEETLKRANDLAEKVLVIVGSSFQPRTYKNPFTFEEREAMIPSELASAVIPMRDSMYNDQAWAVRVQMAVQGRCSEFFPNRAVKIGIIGHEKDETSFYLKLFPQWEHIGVELLEHVHATNIRSMYFTNNMTMAYLRGVVPLRVYDQLAMFSETEEFQQIVRERDFIKEYKKQFAGLAYPPVFVTADSVVIQSGHVLMIKRRAEPGKGLWALPGGFLDANTDRSVQAAAIRELKEETGIKVPVPVLIGSIKNNRVFDAIKRSARGRTITHAFHIELPDGELPKVKGNDDAEKARWVPISELRSEECFEDHWDIITYFIGSDNNYF